ADLRVVGTRPRTFADLPSAPARGILHAERTGVRAVVAEDVGNVDGRHRVAIGRIAFAGARLELAGRRHAPHGTAVGAQPCFPLVPDVVARAHRPSARGLRSTFTHGTRGASIGALHRGDVGHGPAFLGQAHRVGFGTRRERAI